MVDALRRHRVLQSVRLGVAGHKEPKETDTRISEVGITRTRTQAHSRKERKGKERKGKERKGKEKKGKERKGKSFASLTHLLPGADFAAPELPVFFVLGVVAGALVRRSAQVGVEPAAAAARVDALGRVEAVVQELGVFPAVRALVHVLHHHLQGGCRVRGLHSSTSFTTTARGFAEGRV